jgi:hypothetical protein
MGVIIFVVKARSTKGKCFVAFHAAARSRTAPPSPDHSNFEHC